MDEKILEQAGDYADGLVMRGIARTRATKPRPEGFDGSCSCGADIPEQRLAHGFYNCVDCQSLIERRKKYYGS